MPLRRRCLRCVTLASLLAACLWAAPARAQTMVTNIIYQDMFSGTAGTDLNGRTPDTVDTGGATWLAEPTDWTIDGNGDLNSPLGVSSCAFLPFVPVQGSIYTLSANMEVTASYNQCWLGFGFAAAADTGGSILSSPVNAVGWIIIALQGLGPDLWFLGPGATGNVPTTVGSPANSLNSVTTILNTQDPSPANWTFTTSVDGVVVAGPIAFGGSGPVINYIVLGNNLGSTIVQDLTLSGISPAQVAPFFAVSPQSGTYFVGQTVTLSASAEGQPTPTYQWEWNSNTISGATASSLTLSNLALTNAGTYTVVISNSVNTATSAPAVLNVVTPQTYIIYQDQFAGTAGAALNGRTPDTVDTGGATWTADPANWTIDGNGDLNSAAGVPVCAFLPFVPLPGSIYTLSANMEDTLANTAYWVAMGFAAIENTSGVMTTSSLNAVGWQLIGAEGETAGPNLGFLGPAGANGFGETGFYPYTNSLESVTIVLNTQSASPANWTFMWELGGVVAAGPTAFGGSGPVINYVVLGSYYASSIVQDLTLTVEGGPSAPSITTPPQGGTYFVGQTVTLSAAASGLPFPTYQWEVNSNVISGATASSLVLINVALTNAGSYQVVVTNSVGSATSAPVALNVVTPLTNIIYQDQFAGAAGAALNGRTPDTVDAGGATWTADPSWTLDGSGDLNSAEGFNACAFLPFTPAQGNIYTLSANMEDTETSSPYGHWMGLGFAQLEDTSGVMDRSDVNAVGWQLIYWQGETASPEGAYLGPVAPGQSLEAGFIETGFYPPANSLQSVTIVLNTQSASPANWTFTWELGGVVAHPTTAIGGSGPGINYVVLGTWDASSIVQDLTLTVEGGPIAPSITTQPQGGTYFVGQSLTLSVGGVAGLPIPTYQWEWNSNAIPGATANSLTLSNLALTNAGSYQLILSNVAGVATSSPAVLLVSNAPSVVGLSSGLVLHLKFDTDYLDYSGRGNNATSEGSSIVPGIIGSGAMTYGNNGSYDDMGYATLGTNTPPDLLFGHSVNFTLSYWIQYPNVPDNQTDPNYPTYAFPYVDLPIIGNAINSTYTSGWVFAQGGDPYENNPGAFVWSFQDLNGNTVVAQGPAHSEDDANWHSLVHVIDWGRGFGTTYLDGKQVDATSIASINASIDFPALAINIGENPQDNYFSPGAAYLDDLCIWRRALSGDEARSIYAAGVSNHVSVASLPQPITAAVSGGQLTLTWSAGILQSASSLTGPWTAVPGATTPSYTTPATASQQYYRAAQ